MYEYGQAFMSMGNLFNMSVYIFAHVSMYVYMCRPVYVYEHDCFMYVHTCAYNAPVCTL